MKVCPNCQTKYPDDANFCPQEACATPEGPRRLDWWPKPPPARATPSSSSWAADAAARSIARATARRARRSSTSVSRAAVLTSPAIVERAQRELKQLQRAQSPRIARVLDFGKEPDGNLFVPASCATGSRWTALIARAARSARSRQEDRRPDRRGVAGRAEGRRRAPRPGRQERADQRRRRREGDQLRRPVPVTDTVFGVARVPFAGAGRRQAGRPALEHLQPRRHLDADADRPPPDRGGQPGRGAGPGPAGDDLAAQRAASRASTPRSTA